MKGGLQMLFSKQAHYFFLLVAEQTERRAYCFTNVIFLMYK